MSERIKGRKHYFAETRHIMGNYEEALRLQQERDAQQKSQDQGIKRNLSTESETVGQVDYGVGPEPKPENPWTYTLAGPFDPTPLG